MRRVIVLGSTGSIGTAALEVARQLPGRLKVVGLACRDGIDLMDAQAAEFRPDAVAIAGQDPVDGDRFRGARHRERTQRPHEFSHSVYVN